MTRFGLEVVDWPKGQAIVRPVDVDQAVLTAWIDGGSYVELMVKSRFEQPFASFVRAELLADGLVSIDLPSVEPGSHEIRAGLISPRLQRVITCFTFNVERWDLGEIRWRRAIAISEWDEATLFRVRSVCLFGGYSWLSTDEKPYGLSKGVHQVVQISAEELADRADELPLSEAVLSQFSVGETVEPAVAVEPASFDALWSRLWANER